ncbi:MAG TPA: ATP-binding protein [Planctomycetota bacterium]|nr:ATP-binding protein [Planctomycetota bacterium]
MSDYGVASAQGGMADPSSGARAPLPGPRGGMQAGEAPPDAAPDHGWGHTPPWLPSDTVCDPTLACSVAHDLSNVLMLILGHAEMGLGEAGEAGPLRTALEHITHAADVGVVLTGKLLRAEGMRERKPLAGGLNSVLRDAFGMVRPILPPSVIPRLQLDTTLWPVAGDAVAIKQVVINLVDNAREAMPQGGTLTVSTENVLVGEKGWPGVPLARPGEWVCLTVSDTGIGMDAATLGHLFEPYFTAKAQGTGLGLALVQRIARQHGGWIAVTSHIGSGSSFSLFLPPDRSGAREAASA